MSVAQRDHARHHVASVIQVGDDFSCTILDAFDGGAFSCWGKNDRGQLGIGSSATSATAPTGPTQPFDVVKTGATFACATSSGALWCWGDDTFEQLNVAPSMTRYTAPVSAGVNVGNIFALGSNHACAASGTNLTCWGDNASHQASASDAVVVGASSVVVQAVGNLTAGASHTCVIVKGATDGGNVLCVGDNSYGQLGNGGRRSRR